MEMYCMGAGRLPVTFSGGVLSRAKTAIFVNEAYPVDSLFDSEWEKLYVDDVYDIKAKSDSLSDPGTSPGGTSPRRTSSLESAPRVEPSLSSTASTLSFSETGAKPLNSVSMPAPRSYTEDELRQIQQNKKYFQKLLTKKHKGTDKSYHDGYKSLPLEKLGTLFNDSEMPPSLETMKEWSTQAALQARIAAEDRSRERSLNRKRRNRLNQLHYQA